MFSDANYYDKEREYLKYLPLIIGKFDPNDPVKLPFPNTVLLRSARQYTRDCSKGVYKGTLCGLIALSFGISLLDEGEIFLLGYDYGAKKQAGKPVKDHNGDAITHFYQGGLENKSGEKIKLLHRGIGKVNWYTATEIDEEAKKRITRAEIEFRPYKNESKVKIYNVSPDSLIPTFPKIGYFEFFDRLIQQEHREEIILREEVKNHAIKLATNYQV